MPVASVTPARIAGPVAVTLAPTNGAPPESVTLTVIVSVAGESIKDYVTLVRELGPLGDLVEFNISSPNTKLVYEWSRKPGELATLLREVRGAHAEPPGIHRGRGDAVVEEDERVGRRAPDQAPRPAAQSIDETDHRVDPPAFTIRAVISIS